MKLLHEANYFKDLSDLTLLVMFVEYLKLKPVYLVLS